MSSSTIPTSTATPSESALDFLRLDAELGEDEQLVCDAVARMVDKRVLPIISECFETGRFPRELLPELAELELAMEALITRYVDERPLDDVGSRPEGSVPVDITQIITIRRGPPPGEV